MYWWQVQHASADSSAVVAVGSSADSPAPSASGPSLVAAPAATTTAADDRIAVEAASAELRRLAHRVAAVGSLGSENAVVLRPEITGRIAAIEFEEGRPVAQGQVLIRLDDSVLRAQLEQAEAALALAGSQHRRARELSRQGFISSQARDESASQLKVQQAAVALARAQLDKTVISAPFDGVIGLRQVSVGDYVGPGTELVPLESIDPLNVDFRVPEQFLSTVRIGTRVAVQFDALPDVHREAMVDAISPMVDVGGRSILLRAKVPNGDGLLRPGMFARVQLQFDEQDVLMVPEAAISPSGELNYVYRIQNDAVERVGVVLGQRREGLVEIISGLERGDRVLVSGLQKVFDGARVRILAAPGADGPQTS